MQQFRFTSMFIVLLLFGSYVAKDLIPYTWKKKVQCVMICDDETETDANLYATIENGEKCLCAHNINSTEIDKDSDEVDDVKQVRQTRSVDRPLISKLISDNKPQAFSDRCFGDEYWNGSSCIPLISLCPGGYHWNGDTCIIQSSIQTAALVPSPPDTKCALRAKLRAASDSNVQLASTVMPTYSTSPMCPFGFVWTGDKCTRNPPLCPNGYVYRGNICHLIKSQPDIVESTTLPAPDTFEHNRKSGNKWQQKPIDTENNLGLTYEIENTANDMNENNIIANDQTQHCCMIMSPRICRRLKNISHTEQWQCYHQKNRRCSEFCTKPTIYLRPKKFSFIDPILIMPPPPRRLQKLMQNHIYRETNIGKEFTRHQTFSERKCQYQEHIQ